MGSSKHERKKTTKEKVRANAKKSLEEHRKSDAWLQKAERFSHNLLLSLEKQAIAKRLFHDLMGSQRGYKPLQKELDFEVLCANLLYHKKRHPVAISLNRKDWVTSRYRRASYFTIVKKGIINSLWKKEFNEINGHTIITKIYLTTSQNLSKLKSTNLPIKQNKILSKNSKRGKNEFS